MYQENENLSSVVSYPERGPWGDSGYRGDCSGHLVKDLILRFDCKSVFDPAEGGGTVKDVVSGINKYRQKNISYEGRDLKTGFDILNGQMPSEQFDIVWFHPPYWDIIRYSADASDLSACETLAEFEAKLNRCAERLYDAVKPGGIMAILIGDKRKHGRYYPLFNTLLTNLNIGRLRAIIVKLQHNCTSDWKFYGSKNPFFVPIKHEYCLIFQKD
jgi:hypothetical protein